MPHASWTSHLHVPPPCLRPATSKTLVPSLFPYNYLWENHWSFQFSSLSSWPSRFGLTLHDSYSSSISSLFPTPQGPSSRKTDHGWGHAHPWTSTPQVPFIRWRLSLQSLFQQAHTAGMNMKPKGPYTLWWIPHCMFSDNEHLFSICHVIVSQAPKWMRSNSYPGNTSSLMEPQSK